jgi:hypothetical protein
MIGSLVLYIIYLFVWGVTSPLRLLSDVSLSTDLTASVSQIGGYLTSLTQFLPVSTIISIMGLIVVVEGGIFLYKGIMWVVRRIPTQS